jgi:hypothetical protein
MLIEEKPLQHWIENFYGYGSWQARFWFIAYEEGGGDMPEEVADKVNYFYNVPAQTDGTLCDIRELYKQVAVMSDGPKANSFNNLYEYRFDKNAVLNNIWKNLIAFAHGYQGATVPDLLHYQKHTFTSPSLKQEALIKLYPLPAPHSHAWYYSWLDLPEVSFLKSRKKYQEQVYQRRMRSIVSNIGAYKPEVVLMYGMDNINSLKNSVQEFFYDAKFKMVKATAPTAIGGQIPQHHRVDLGRTALLITTQIPALRHNRIETGFDWEAFGKNVKHRV